MRKRQPFSAIRFLILLTILIIQLKSAVFLSFGHSENGRLLFIAHSDDGETIRIISVREPTRGEREQYEQGQN